MLLLRKHVDFIRLVAVLVGGALLSACMTWQTQPLKPERFSADNTQTVRLTLTSGDTLIVHGPVITGDSLVGMETRPGPPYSYRVSIPLTAISEVAVRNDHSQAIVLGVVGTGLLVAATVAIAHTCFIFCKSEHVPQ